MIPNSVLELRHALHEIPERSDQERQTMQLLIRFLQKHTTLEIYPKNGWFYALHREPGRGADHWGARRYGCH